MKKYARESGHRELSPGAFLVCASLCGALGCGNKGAEPTTEIGVSRANLNAADGATSAGGAQHYTLFEAGAVRPVAVLPSGLVAVTNIPDDRVELFRPVGHGVQHCGSVKVGLRPVALGVVGSKLWVVNHLSDSVSILDVDDFRCSAEVERTLLVGDEPRDVVSARAPNGERYAFVTVAHRGQNVTDGAGNPRDPRLTT
ncbi:MAG TPA: hypothetical protein VHU80_03000, partial [Polyangiaceae bacterium]|nr:hypothetical protein [Polyangiaceae bacterium]